MNIKTLGFIQPDYALNNLSHHLECILRYIYLFFYLGFKIRGALQRTAFYIDSNSKLKIPFALII